MRYLISTLAYAKKETILTGSEKCQCRSTRVQRNHLACCYHAWLSLKIQAKTLKITVYQVKKDILQFF
jgi:CRISPR/Cas system endoribonuclease Cas6 (RAMP superfamily)